MENESDYPDEAIRTLLGLQAVPGQTRRELEQAVQQDYTARCAALCQALDTLPDEARYSMTEEQLSVLSLGAPPPCRPSPAADGTGRTQIRFPPRADVPPGIRAPAAH
ncbi:hypothetical protein SA2016_0920 [Sinomonas atrocyanea]|uniref:Uncharacterized protein n=1 Tax=Sinomonas atrocyanea TaxID=37927 RepID=A0A126ZXC3_9MICC|nr:hypothetical protein [Sinomonas atrocyanea]AMM31607.1 hypothetical protein SA2016_0920 [Sinomonas atrocyanea]